MKKLTKVPVTPNGQWEYPGQPTMVPSPSGRITMKGVPYPVMGVDETGHSIMMMPGGEYQFPGDMVYEQPVMKNGGYTVTRSNDRKGKTHKVTGPDGTVKHFGDSKLGQHPKDPERKAAFYARHKKNLEKNPYFRAFARKTWEEGGQTDSDAEMLEGVADMLRQVKDGKNRKEIAEYMMGNFRDENVSFNPNDFLEDAQVFAQGGEMIRRADGSYSRRGLWDNIRANKGSGKKPTKEMLEQERKINAKMQDGGWLDAYQEGGSQKVLPSWLTVNTNTPAQIRSMTPGANDYNLDDYAQGDISQDVRDALNNSKFKLAATKDMGKLGRLNVDTSVRPFAEESRIDLPNITYENSIGNDNRNLDVRFGPEGQSFSATSNKFIQGSADLNRTRTPEGFDTQASMNVRFPNNRGSVTRSVAYKDGENPYMRELQAAYRMGKTNLNAFTRTEDGQNSYGAGLNTSMGPLDVNGNVGFNNQGVQNYMVSGKLNLVEPSRRNPNSGTLDLTGRYGASRNQQGSMNPNYNIGLSYSNEFEQGGPTGWLDKYQEGGDQESSLENFAEFFDPTGMLSWGDAQRAYNQWQKSNSTLPSMGQALDMFGAVPGLVS